MLLLISGVRSRTTPALAPFSAYNHHLTPCGRPGISLMSFLSLPQWRGPVRQKSSTPFFPGAWPSTPSGASTTERTSDSDDIEALKRVDGGRSHSSPDSSVPHLGHAPGFSKRGSQSRAESSPARHALGHRTLNVEIPMSPHLTGLSEYTVSPAVPFHCA